MTTIAKVRDFTIALIIAVILCAANQPAKAAERTVVDNRMPTAAILDRHLHVNVPLAVEDYPTNHLPKMGRLVKTPKVIKARPSKEAIQLAVIRAISAQYNGCLEDATPDMLDKLGDCAVTVPSGPNTATVSALAE